MEIVKDWQQDGRGRRKELNPSIYYHIYMSSENSSTLFVIHERPFK
jgi:hypothetical protein